MEEYEETGKEMIRIGTLCLSFGLLLAGCIGKQGNPINPNDLNGCEQAQKNTYNNPTYKAQKEVGKHALQEINNNEKTVTDIYAATHLFADKLGGNITDTFQISTIDPKTYLLISEHHSLGFICGNMFICFHATPYDNDCKCAGYYIDCPIAQPYSYPSGRLAKRSITGLLEIIKNFKLNDLEGIEEQKKALIQQYQEWILENEEKVKKMIGEIEEIIRFDTGREGETVLFSTEQQKMKKEQNQQA